MVSFCLNRLLVYRPWLNSFFIYQGVRQWSESWLLLDTVRNSFEINNDTLIQHWYCRNICHIAIPHGFSNTVHYCCLDQINTRLVNHRVHVYNCSTYLDRCMWLRSRRLWCQPRAPPPRTTFHHCHNCCVKNKYFKSTFTFWGVPRPSGVARSV